MSAARAVRAVHTELDGRRCVCEGRFSLAVEPAVAFPLFTPLGEIDWVPGWRPTFVHPIHGRLEVDQVFTTDAGGETTLWSVVRADAVAGRAEYLRVTPGSRLGRVVVTVDAAPMGCDVAVRYVLTALADEALPILRAFAEGYGEMLEEWRARTTAWLAARHTA